MKPAPFDYVRAKSLGEALAALGDDAMPLAGGQSLLPLLGLRMASARLLVDIGHLDELRQSSATDATVTLGAAVTHAEIEDGRVPDPGHGLMRSIARKLAYRAVRNQGTIGGSVAMADPAADWPACLVALGATARIAGPDGERRVAVTDLIEDIYTTSLVPGEIIVSFDIPRLHAAAKTGTAKVMRKTGAFAMSFVVAVLHDGDQADRIVLAGAGRRAERLAETSDAVAAGMDEAALRAAVAADLAGLMDAPDDYAVRLHTAVVLRALAEARRS
ncbi:FAD binding domain-containing protein [Rhodoplanes roseus]|uniref:FAD-binding PCMH-type domain-containing protein n=1 Tax=Rhodoplanes roseus TaxID=29409 RepID=A0A327KUE9_9BRAD|nr:FAD binding domain-containing protein [Rhodoplanes roseus]RAI42540.1 hypothetical protein CH341_18970 [Rhodoplanes roseus]